MGGRKPRWNHTGGRKCPCLDCSLDRITKAAVDRAVAASVAAVGAYLTTLARERAAHKGADA